MELRSAHFQYLTSQREESGGHAEEKLPCHQHDPTPKWTVERGGNGQVIEFRSSYALWDACLLYRKLQGTSSSFLTVHTKYIQSDDRCEMAASPCS